MNAPFRPLNIHTLLWGNRTKQHRAAFANSFPHWASWLIIGLFDSASLLILSCCLLVATTSPAFGYVDPSVMTYTIQAVAGVAVALGAVLGVALRRTRRFLFRVFKIDENANKVVEPKVSAFSENPETLGAQQEEADHQARLVKETLTRGKAPKRLSWPKRFVRALIVSLFLVWGICVFTPVDLVVAGSESLLFGLFDILGILIAGGIVVTIVLALLVSCLRDKAFDVALALLTAIGVGCYLQALFLNPTLPVADGHMFWLNEHLPITIISSVVWLALLVGFLLFNAKKKAYCRALVLVISILLFSVQGITAGVVTYNVSTKLADGHDPVIATTYGLNEVGQEDNITVFVLDTFDTSIMETLLANNPAILDEYTGFTYFRNSTGSLIPTRFGVPYLLTHTMPEPHESYNDYLANRYQRSTLVSEIADAGFEVGIYTDSCDEGFLDPYTANIMPYSSRSFDDVGLWVSLQKMSLFRDMPWVLKPLFWFYTDELNAHSNDAYLIDDIRYGNDLRTQGLALSRNASKTFRFIHLLGAHYPYVMNEKGHPISHAMRETDADMLVQSEGALGLVTDYIGELKRLGVYDQSTIIVTADHGLWQWSDTELKKPVSPFLLVKPKETPAEAAVPLKTSNAPTGHIDIAATLMAAVGKDPSAYGPTVFDVPEGLRNRYYWDTLTDHFHDFALVEYVVDGHVLDLDSWHLTGEEILIEPDYADCLLSVQGIKKP